MAAVTIEEREAELADLKSQIVDLEKEHEGERFDSEAKEKWNRLNSEVDEKEEEIKELRAREARVGELSAKEEHVERGNEPFRARPSRQSGDIFDLTSVKRDFNDPSVEGRELRDRAKKAIEQARFPHEQAARNADELRGHAEMLLETVDTDDGQIARRILVTGSPTYKRAFGKYLMGSYLTNQESQVLSMGSERALSLTGSAGGYAVPFTLDPSIIPTSNLAVNPFRAISRVVQVSGDEWRGISSAGITSAYAAEATAASDNAPTLAQPTISTEKAQAFIPYSIEVGMDWNGLQAEMGRLLQDSKDELEATKFAVGSGTNEPQGVITGATTVVTASGTASFAYADLDSLEAALGPRFRPRAAIVMNRAIAQKVRHFDTAGSQTSVWNQSNQLQQGLPNQVPTPGSYQAQILGYPAYESSAMASALTTGSLIAVLGDFNYFVIVDRIGLTVETIPHLFDVTNNRPTGQRGLYAYWRNSSGVISANAFRVLKTG